MTYESHIQQDSNAILKATGAETGSTNTAGIDIGPIGLCEIVVNCTAGWATDTLSISIQQSDDDGSVDHYAHPENLIAYLPATTGSAAGMTTADAFGGVGFIWRQPCYITKRYVRCASTHGSTVSKTFQVTINRVGA